MSTFYISTSGNDTTGNGTSGNPWLTLAKGLTGSTTGDTLVFAAGSYTFDNATITGRTIQGATTAQSPISTTGWTVFNGAGAAKVWTYGSGITAVKNVWITNLAGANYVLNIDGAATATLTVSGCRFSNITLATTDYHHNVIGGGFGGLSTINIQSCIFDDILSSSAYQLYTCLFSLRVFPSGSTMNFFNNVVTWRTSINQGVNGFSAHDTSGCIFNIKNSIFRNLQSSRRLVGAYEEGGNTFTFTNCDYSGSWSTADVTTLTNCITSDPLFIDESNADFRLRPTSPCKGLSVPL